MTKRLPLPFIACLLVLAGPACAELRIGLMPAYNSIPLVVAEAAGFFIAEGLAVQLIPFSSQLNRETALQANAIDGTVSDLINAIQSWAQGSGARVTSVTEGNFSLLSSPHSTLRTLEDWKARAPGRVRTGLLENSIVYYMAERMLAAGHVDPAGIEIVPIVQLPARVEMLLADRVEAACLPEPLATLAEARGAQRLADSDALGTTPGVLLFTAKALATKQSEISGFYKAYDRAVLAVNAAPGTYRNAIVNRCEFPPAVSPVMRIPRFRPSFTPAAAQVADVARWMNQKGLVSRTPAYDDVVRSGYASSNAGNQ